MILKQPQGDTLDLPVRIFGVVNLRESGMAVLQGIDGTNISHQVAKLAHHSVPVADSRVYPKTYVGTDAVHCHVCGSKFDPAVILLCYVCNKGFHINCLGQILRQVTLGSWKCETHKVNLLHT